MEKKDDSHTHALSQTSSSSPVSGPPKKTARIDATAPLSEEELVRLVMDCRPVQFIKPEIGPDDVDHASLLLYFIINLSQPKGLLNPKYVGYQAALDLVNQDNSLFQALQNAWRIKKFTSIRQLPQLRNPVPK